MAEPAAVRPVSSNRANLIEAGRVLRAGGLVAFPTDTVYGLGADATDDDAVAKVFAAKGRPGEKALIVHFASAEAAARVVRFDETASRLARAFWPGPLTLILPRRPDCPVSPLASAGRETLAVRVPNHPTALALLQAAGRPLTAPSANPSGRAPATTAAAVAASLGGAVDMILDGGACRLGVASTVIDLTGPEPLILRRGALSRAEIEDAVGPMLGASHSR